MSERLKVGTINDEKLQLLVAAALDGDAAAYRFVLRMVADRVRSFVGRRLDHGALADDVEDVVQLVLLAVHEKRDTYDRTRPFMPWVYGIARYKLLEHLRAHHRRLKMVSFDERADLNFDDGSVDGLSELDPAARHDVAVLLEKLADGPREAVVLTKLEGCSVDEAAQKTGLSPTAVKVRVHRAMKALRKMAKED